MHKLSWPYATTWSSKNQDCKTCYFSSDNVLYEEKTWFPIRLELIQVCKELLFPLNAFTWLWKGILWCMVVICVCMNKWIVCNTRSSNSRWSLHMISRHVYKIKTFPLSFLRFHFLFFMLRKIFSYERPASGINCAQV